MSVDDEQAPWRPPGLRRWEKECAEWQAIRDEMVAAGLAPSAFQVSLEQRKRMLARGERPITYEELVAE